MIYNIMMLKNKIFSDMKEAMKAGDTIRRDTLRMLDAMIKNTEIEKLKKEEGLDDQEVREVISRAVRQRKDAAQQYTAGGRPELAEKESKEVEILMAYMPEQMGEDKIHEIIKEIIIQTGAATEDEIGKVMGAAMGKLKGQADGNLVKKIVEEELK